MNLESNSDQSGRSSIAVELQRIENAAQNLKMALGCPQSPTSGAEADAIAANGEAAVRFYFGTYRPRAAS